MFNVNSEAVRRSIYPVATSITIRHYNRSSITYDEDTQTPTNPYTDTTILADVQNVSTRQILNSGGKITPETKQIIVPDDTTVSELDDVYYSSTTLQVIEVKFLTNRYVLLANKKLS